MPTALALRRLTTIAVAILLAAGGAARAEKADRFKPLNVEADLPGKIDLINQFVVFNGNVVVTKGTMVIRAARIEVRETPDGYHTAVAIGSPGQSGDLPPEARRRRRIHRGRRRTPRVRRQDRHRALRQPRLGAAPARQRRSPTRSPATSSPTTASPRSSASPAARRRRPSNPGRAGPRGADAARRHRGRSRCGPPPRRAPALRSSAARREACASRPPRAWPLGDARMTATAHRRRPSSTPGTGSRRTGLQKSYGARDGRRQDVRLAVDSGEVVGLLGPNGAGKTTSFYMIVGLVRADAGEITHRRPARRAHADPPALAPRPVATCRRRPRSSAS